MKRCIQRGSLSLCALFVLAANSLFSQEISGTVREKDAEGKLVPLPGAVVKVLPNKVQAATDVSGNFSLRFDPSWPDTLVASMVGYNADTLILKGTEKPAFTLTPVIKLKEAVVVGSSDGFSLLKPMGTEVIGKKELLKAACCNLSESFQNNATVDVNFSDAVSGAKQIQMLGLDGTYSQINYENLPLIRGLSASYGLNFVPGTWIESIQISKGTGSVVNGYESITGQINLELLKPTGKEPLFVNSYVNNQGRAEVNVHGATEINEKWSTMLFGHASGLFLENDMNRDKFRDVPQYKQLNVFSRWNYESGKRMEGKFGVKALYEDRLGGQLNFDEGDNFSASPFFGIGIMNRQLEAFSKTGWVFPDKPYNSLGIITQAKHHMISSHFGRKQYAGEENSAYVNAIWQSKIVDTRHTYRTGFSYLYDNFSQVYNDSLFRREESVPGVFYEYSYTDPDKFTAVLGVRADEHNLFGTQVNPRAHFKYNPSKRTAIRLAGGRGFRVANPFAEASSVLASARTVVIAEKLLPEVAWNYGITFTQNFKLFGRDATVNADFFRTDFENQMIVDTDTDPRTVYFYNLSGRSYSNSGQIDLNFSPLKNLEIKMAYKKYDVKTTYRGRLEDRLLLIRDRALLNASYATQFEKWKADVTVQWFGTAPLPDLSANPAALQRGKNSSPYALLFAQISRNFPKWGVYLGAENITNFMQHHPIVDPANPFGRYFDASMIWGPIMGRVIYAGFRYKPGKKQ